MFKRTSTILFLSLLMAAFLVTTAFAAHTKSKNTVPASARVKATANALAYSFADERPAVTGTSQKGRIPVGAVAYSSSAESPGQIVGDTWYDQQHNCSMGRMIETGPHSGQTGPTTVHFGWMYSPDASLDTRSYAYNAYNSGSHQYAGAYVLHDVEYSGYVNIDVTPDNRGIVGGHTDVHGPVKYQPQMHFDACSSCEDFAAFTRLPDSLAAFGQDANLEATWPKFFLQFGTDTVLHVVAGNDYGAYYMSLMYFRCVGYEGEGEWDYPPYVFDTVRDIAYDITGQRMDDRIGITWMAHPPYEEPWCDTCSGLTPTAYLDWAVGQMDNDVYIQTSDDQGANFAPKQNLTKVPIGEAAFKGYCDNSILLDQAGNLHVIWHAHPWPADPNLDMNWGGDGFFWPDKSRLLHWSENVPYIRTICDHTYEPSDSCGSCGWAMTVAKPTLSECDGKLYAIWSQFNDVPHGVHDDCALWVYDQGLYWGGANSDLWVSVSSDGGMTWDVQRNLTNSYTPRCDAATGEDCQSDHWASMSRWGRQVQGGEDWTSAEVVDPSGGSSPTDWFLDIQYVNDLEAGRAISTDDYEGEFTNNPIKWFRMPCIEPEPNPIPVFSMSSIGFPAWGPPGIQIDTPFTVENVGNVNYNYTIDIVEDNGPSGWLGVTGFSGSVPSGLGNVETGAIVLNQGGVVNEDLYPMVLTGQITFNCVDVESPTVIPISFLVVDTLVPPEYDTVHTNCLALICGNNGNIGGGGYGGVNMDHVDNGDCDTTATVYLYEGSPLIGWINGDDTIMNYYMWGGTWGTDYGLMPQGGKIATKVCDAINAEIYHSGVFSSNDSTIAMEKVVVAPLDDCPFIIEYLKVYSYDGLAHAGLIVGEAIDWDIPFDNRDDDTAAEYWDVCNYGGVDVTRSLIYQQGYEASGDWDTLYPFDCQLNTERYGGNAFVASFFNGAPAAGGPYSAFIGENDSLQRDEGWWEGKLYYEMLESGFKATDSIEDLHAVMCFDPTLDLGATDYYEVVTVLATVQQGTLADLQDAIDAGKNWFTNNGGIAIFADIDGANGIDICQGCCELMGDLNGDDYFDPLDVTYFVNWLWKGGPSPVCCPEADVNGDSYTDPLDLTYMVNHIWKGGPAPVFTCSETAWVGWDGPCPD